MYVLMIMSSCNTTLLFLPILLCFTALSDYMKAGSLLTQCGCGLRSSTVPVRISSNFQCYAIQRARGGRSSVGFTLSLVQSGPMAPHHSRQILRIIALYYTLRKYLGRLIWTA